MKKNRNFKDLGEWWSLLVASDWKMRVECLISLFSGQITSIDALMLMQLVNNRFNLWWLSGQGTSLLLRGAYEMVALYNVKSILTDSKLLQTSHVTTQNDRKRSRILMEMFSEVTLKTLRPFQALFCNFWVILGSFGAILGPKMTWTSWSWVSKPSSSAFCSTCGRFEWSHD